MKLRAFILGAIAAGACAAQERIPVPLTNPSQPATVKATEVTGSITVTVGSGPEVVVVTGAAKAASRGRIPPGMHRIGATAPVNIEEDHNVVTITAAGMAPVNMQIEVPAHTNLQLRTTNGRAITVTGVTGDIEAENTNGSIVLTNVSGSVVAHTVNGSVTASLDKIVGTKPMSFAALNGKVDVTLPESTKARLRMKSQNGAIYSDFDVKLEPTAANEKREGGRYVISTGSAITGTINGGGPEYTFQTMNGKIEIHKK